MIGVLIMYGICFAGLGVLYMICSERTAKQAGPRNRVKYDARIKRHSNNGPRYHNVGERMYKRV